VELTKGRYINFMESKNREVRKSAFEALYSIYKGLINTLAATTSANVKRDIFYKNQRKFNSSLEKSLFADNVPVKVYDNLIDTIHRRLDLMHRYIKIRKKALGLDELHMYDIYVPLVKDYDKKVSYEEAQTLVLEGLSPMGKEYVDILKQGFNSGWIDVYENRGKTGGAYSWGCYGTHPYVLLNFQGKLNDVFTIAHEMGHAIHTYYSFSHQPYVYAQYPIILAEVASTCNEAILINYLLERAKQKEEKMFLLNHFMEQFKGTVYRQVMFAEFEKMTHEMAESGEPLNAEVLNKVYHELNVKYYGRDIVVDEQIDYEWARIPHFYTSFYVYKYATGFSAAIAISEKILKEGSRAVERFKEFLSGGSSDYPLELLKKVGVDLTEPKPVMDALQVFEKLLDEYESLM
jgi:oligoendopeptidase F